MQKYLCIQRYPNRLCSGCTSACNEPVSVSTTVRDWQTDSAHDRKTAGADLRAGRFPSPWAVRDGIVVNDERGHTASWAIGMVIACQQARATEAF